MTATINAMSLGGLLQHYRGRARLTQTELAGLSAVSVRAIRNLELGLARNPRKETIRLLADALRLGGGRRAALFVAAGLQADDATFEVLSVLPAVAATRPHGRSADLERTVGLLRRPTGRIVTAAGLGGSGKTRLALAAAHALHCETGLPTLWMSVPRTAGPDTSLHTDGLQSAPARWMEGLLARTCGAAAEAARLLGDRDVLLVIDGNDTTPDVAHVSRATMDSLLEECPRLRILETARTARDREQDRTVQLGPLHLQDLAVLGGPHPAPPSPALAVLLDRIAELRPGYRPDTADTAALREICSLLDGLPRALESVASWLVLCPPEELVSMARTDPLLLAAPPCDTATDSWIERALVQAVAGLTPDQRALLARLTDRDGPWTVEQMAQQLGLSRVSAAVAVQAMLHQGLVRPEHTDRRIAFSVLNLVRAAGPSVLPRVPLPAHPSLSTHSSHPTHSSQQQEEVPHDGADHRRDARRFGTAAGVLRDRSRRDHAA
ncbi:helix-turn-helix domain-containing protein [Streptomyces sp. RPA4-5]|uniref:helix-turn-helix domain-containing protein n=1 Tax=Streptomyces sp. RPA4-5 TaxID=2721245 RepID=UPI00143E31D5|nr:helix-turn-helix domain-containing protein [Streptomyces sp. RPA4-5]QIY58996.1 helix-turn-helix domain-containing protein [Streptomyces sp. RPA4-5]